MKFNCNKSLLTESVLNVSRMVPSKSSIPALEGIKIIAKEDSLTLTGYDMEAGITTTIEAGVVEAGEIVLSARLFSDMIRKMDGDNVEVTVGDKYLTTIKSGLTEFTILGIPSEEFPEMPVIEEESSVAIQQSSLKSMIDQTLFAVAVTDTKPVHTGSLFEIEDNLISLVSVDGYRLALRKEKIDTDLSMKFVVPGKVLNEISKMIKEDSEKEGKILIGSRHIIFEIGKYAITSRLLEGDFLEYKNTIPKAGVGEVKINTRDFIDSVERASLLISDRLRSPLKINFDSNNTIKINCSTSLGKFSDEISCETSGETVEMGFNNKYLLDALRASGTDKIRIELSGPLSPIKMLPVEGDSFLFLVLPVRLKNEI